jgi:hypothetical protein
MTLATSGPSGGEGSAGDRERAAGSGQVKMREFGVSEQAGSDEEAGSLRGASTDKPLPRPATTSMVRWVCFQYSYWDADIQKGTAGSRPGTFTSPRRMSASEVRKSPSGKHIGDDPSQQSGLLQNRIVAKMISTEHPDRPSSRQVLATF